MPIASLPFPRNITSGPLRPVVRYALSLGAMLAVAFLYQLTLVPLFEPTFDSAAKPFDAQGLAPADALNARNYAALFPDGAWERDNPKVFRTPHGSLLFQDYRTGDNGRLNLHPVTLVVEMSGDSETNRPDAKPRWIVMQAPDGAELKFQRALSLMSANAGKLLGGRLRGEVTLRSPPSHPGADDDLFVRTQNLKIDPARIWTTADVEFRFGPNSGTGRELMLAFDDLEPAPNRLVLGKLSSLELVHLDHLQLELPNSARGSLSATGALARTAAEPPTHLQVDCDGPLVFDFAQQTASLRENVHVTRTVDSGSDDHLFCQQLQAFFAPSRTGKSQPVAGRVTTGVVEKLVAVGEPLVLEGGSVGARARCRTLEYDIPRRTLRLADPQGVQLEHRNRSVTAPRVEYELAHNPHRIGRLRAAGAGRFQELNNGHIALRANWSEELRLEPQGATDGLAGHVLSLFGGAQLQSTEQGSLSANQIHAWLRQSASSTPRRKSQSGDRLGFEKMLATGSVRLDSQRILAAVDRLEVWLDDISGPSESSQTSSQPSVDASRSPTAPQAAVSASLPLRRYRLSGRTAQLHFVREGEETMLENASIDGRVEIAEIASPQSGQPLMLAGDHLELSGGGSDNPKILLVGSTASDRATSDAPRSGQSALIAGRGIALRGETIQLHRGTNQLWVNGAGRITWAADRETGPASEAGPLDLQWSDHLAFDGQTAAAGGGVIIRGKRIQATGDFSDFVGRGEDVRVALSKRLEFSKPRFDQDIQAQQLFFVGPAELENRSFNATGLQQSQDRLEVSNLSLQVAAGDLRADGPGRLSSVRYDRDPLDETSRGASGLPPRPAELFYLDARFAHEMTGNLEYREITFRRQVQVVYGPVTRWEDRLAAEQIVGRQRRGGVLHGDQLTVADTNGKRASGVELLAHGNIRVEGRETSGFFTATGHALKYAHHKDLLILEGNGRAYAVLTRQQRIGAEPQTTHLERIVYHPRTNKLSLEGVQSVELNSALRTVRPGPRPGSGAFPGPRPGSPGRPLSPRVLPR